MTNKEIAKKLENALTEYLYLSKQDEKIFPLTLSGDDKPQPTKYMARWMSNLIKLKLSKERLIKVFKEYKKSVN